MKRLNNSDANIILDSKTINVANFTARFYTVNAEEFFIEKTQNDVVFDDEKATIKLDWRELVTLGEGVLQYQIINNIEDADRADKTYHKNIERTTDYYINSDIIYDDSKSKSYAEMIEQIGADLQTEIARSTTEDVNVNNKLNNEITRSTTEDTNLNRKIDNEITRATARENTIDQRFNNYIPASQKGANNGVATLNGSGLIPQDQLQFPTRGQIPPNINDTNLDCGVYQVNGKVISSDVLSGETANGIFVNYPYGSKVQVLYVGRAAGAAMGEQVEIYTRRYLPTPQRWTDWNHLTQQDYTLEKSGTSIQLKKNGVLVGQVADSNTTYSNMSQSEATKGTAATARLISSKVLNKTIDDKIDDKADKSQMEELVISATSGGQSSVELPQGSFEAIQTAIDNGKPKSMISVLLDGYRRFRLGYYFKDNVYSFVSCSGEESFLSEISIYFDNTNDYFFRSIPYVEKMTQAAASQGTSNEQRLISPKILVDTINEKANTIVDDYYSNKHLNYKATSINLTWKNSWGEGGDDDLTKIELLRNGNIVYLSGCIKNTIKNAFYGEIFTVPNIFRPSRSFSWVQMGQDWFQVDGADKAVSYSCQINPNGTFKIQTLNCGGSQINYQADKNLIVSGMWMVE